MTNDILIKIYSKDKKSLKRFKIFLESINEKWENFTFTIKDNKKKKKKVTILKSPHVNKKAQTQFQSITYSANIRCFSFDLKKSYILLKKIKNHLFPDVKITISRTILNKKAKFSTNKLFSTRNLYFYQNTSTLFTKKKLLAFNEHEKKKKVVLKKTLHFLKVLDKFGNSYS